MKNCIIISFIFILLNIYPCSCILAQKYNFKTYSLEDGLVQSQVFSICQDNDGNMWFGTFGGGVSKFNGQTFETYTIKDGFISNDIRTIMLDSKGNLWFGTREGISKLDFNKSTCSSKNHKNRLCIKNYTTEDGLMNNYISSVFEDNKGNIWFGSWRGEEGGISRILNIDEEASARGENKIDGLFENFTTKQGLPDSNVTAITQDKQGYLWFGTYKGVSKLLISPGSVPVNDSAKIFQNLSEDEGLISHVVLSLLTDNKGNIWVGTTKGISILTPNINGDQAGKDSITYKITNISKEDGLKKYKNNCSY